MAGFRFTLSHEILGDLVISEPDGWKGAKIVLERDKDLFSLIEYYKGSAEGSFVFYGDNGTENGGIDFIKQVEQTYGPDAQIDITVEFTPDDVYYEELFTGQLDLFAKNEMTGNKMQVPIIREDFWAKFINRFDTPVDLSSLTDLDGNAVDAAEPIDLFLTSQKVRMSYRGESTTQGYTDYPASVITEGTYYQMSYDEVELEELKETFLLPQIDNTELPAPWFEPEYAGTYTFEFQTVAHDYDPAYAPWGGGGDDIADYIRFYLNIEGVETEFTVGSLVTSLNIDGGRIYTLTHTATLAANAKVWLYGKAIATLISTPDYPGTIRWNGKLINATVDGNNVDIECYARITADTTFPATQAEGYLIHDAIDAVVKRIVGNDHGLYSEYMGSAFTLARQYEDDGCAWNFGIVKGLQLRGYSLTEKPFFISLRQLWNGINPILNFGLGYETIDGVQMIRIEEKAHFFNETQSIELSNVRDITSKYDINHIFKTIKTGYKKWQSENISGLDDPQTKRTYATRFEKAGTELTIESDFIAASLAIENTRRTTREKNADYKYDNDTFIIALEREQASPGLFYPELSENFTSITGLINSSTRYNSILTPARNLLRWANYIGGCLQLYTSSVYRFVSGEGNYDMVSDYDCAGGMECQAVLCGSVSEKGNITVGDIPDYIFYPLEYPITIPLTWDEFTVIRNALKNAVGISQTDSAFAAFFLNKFEYDIVNGEVTFSAWPKRYFDIQNIESTFEMSGCTDNSSTGGGSAGLDTCYRITEDDLIRITEDGDNRISENCD